MIEIRCYSDQTLQLLEEQARKDGSDYQIVGTVFYIDSPSSEFIDIAKDQGVDL